MTPFLSDRTSDPDRGEIGGLLLFVSRFSSPINCLLGGSPGWVLTQGTVQVIDNNDLCLDWVWYNSSGFLDVWEAKSAAGDPYLFNYWEPTAIFVRFFFFLLFVCVLVPGGGLVFDLVMFQVPNY